MRQSTRPGEDAEASVPGLRIEQEQGQMQIREIRCSRKSLQEKGRVQQGGVVNVQTERW
jgi:hypothetical protein